MTGAERLKRWRLNNPEKYKAQRERDKEKKRIASKLYREKTKERAAETRLEWQRKNKEKVRLSCKRWREQNPDKNVAKAMRYRANKKKRFANWDRELTELVVVEAANLCSLRKLATGVEWQVDHVIPLCGKEVSGLHVWNNLSVIPKIQNIAKSNKFEI